MTVTEAAAAVARYKENVDGVRGFNWNGDAMMLEHFQLADAAALVAHDRDVLRATLNAMVAALRMDVDAETKVSMAITAARDGQKYRTKDAENG